MKFSVIIIAYNEAKNIAKCLESLLVQSKKATEIVVIAHNCTDEIVEIASRFLTVRVVNYTGPEGIIYARIKGFQEAKNEIVACIDGDSWAEKKWLENLTKPFINQKISATGGYVKMTGSVFAWLSAVGFFFISPIVKSNFHFYFWGANFACRKNDYFQTGGLKPLIKLRKEKKLNFWATDLYLSLALEKRGKVIFAPKAKVFSVVNESVKWGMKRVKKQNHDRKKLLQHFGWKNF